LCFIDPALRRTILTSDLSHDLTHCSNHRYACRLSGFEAWRAMNDAFECLPGEWVDVSDLSQALCLVRMYYVCIACVSVLPSCPLRSRLRCPPVPSLPAISWRPSVPRAERNFSSSLLQRGHRATRSCSRRCRTGEEGRSLLSCPLAGVVCFIDASVTRRLLVSGLPWTDACVVPWLFARGSLCSFLVCVLDSQR
jgi:hypothetical protein